MNRAYYSSDIKDFISKDAEHIYGLIASKYDLTSLEIQQKNAWIKQIEILKNTLQEFSGPIYFEFSIPRMGKRVDNIIVINNCIFIIEFKVGAPAYDNYAKDQVLGYALDMNNFHEGSHNKTIIPILVATKAPNHPIKFKQLYDNLYDTIFANESNLADIIRESLSKFSSPEKIDVNIWETSSYKPTPTIIEAATALYQNHSVEEISRSGADNLTITSQCISDIIDYSKYNYRKSICFVTGVPGAGKTLAGLNVANIRSNYEAEEHTVFLSGNQPLVAVLQEALTRDRAERASTTNKRESKDFIRSQVKSFIQLIHHFRDASLKDPKPPIEKVTIFDEAQRAWTQQQTAKFMKEKKGVHDFSMSEPEFLIEVMNRHDDWCTIVCLVGGGQEINTGEAGIEEWIDPFATKFEDWDIYYSPKIITDYNYIKEQNTITTLNSRGATSKPELHLSVSLRSFKSAQLSNFINELMYCNTELAQNLFTNYVKDHYPIYVTRDLEIAKNWLKQNAVGSNRVGIIASSGARRLRSFGINIKEKISAPEWFLNDKNDIRSSYFLEEVATEFDIQGLELDYTCVAWDGNLFFNNGNWNYRRFTGTTWKYVNTPSSINYLVNSYRVLLTRARQGMVIYVPFGNTEDQTRPSYMYDGTYNYLKTIGIKEL